MKVFWAIGILLLALGCKKPPAASEGQGISGTVWWLEGDFMPSIGTPPPGKRMPAQREVFIYPALTQNEVSRQGGPVYPTLPGTPVAKTSTDSSGQFTVALPPGMYSVFTREENGFFANSFNSDGVIGAVVVNSGSFTVISIDINYMATF